MGNNKKEIDEYLGIITNKLLSSSILTKDNLNLKEYEILSKNIDFFKDFYKRYFSLELLYSNGSFQIRKVSKSSPIGLGNMAKKEDYVFFVLILSELVEYEKGNTFFWNNIVDLANKKYRLIFGEYIDTKDLYRYSRATKKYLSDKDHKFIEIREEENPDDESAEILYTLLKEVKSDEFNKIDLEKYFIKRNFKERKDIRNTVSAISQFLLLNGYMDADNAPELYPILIYDEKVRGRVYHIFERLNYDKLGYVLLNIGNSHTLCYIGDLNFPKNNESSGVLFLELISKINNRNNITKKELKEFAKESLTYKDRKTIKNNFNSIFKDLLEKMIYFGFLKNTDIENNFEITEFCKHVNAYYDDNDKEEILNKKKGKNKNDGQMSFV